ncbi:MAG: EamA family transporter [Alphaproteobacteria bacterium]|nr:EamA family transporter [Alphaproteobacteria bacterium]MBV9540189.1 EamA family transporter [Alphaproteobacteria bacterium]
MTFALILIFVSAAVHAVVNVLTKRADDKYAMRLLIGVFSAVLVTPALFFLPLPSGRAWWFLAGTAVVHAIYELLLVKSYESAAFSAVYPVARGTGPLFTALGAILVLREPAPWVEVLGVVMVCGGVIAIGLSHRATEGALKGIGFALGTGLTIGIYTLIDASGVRAVPEPLTYVLWFFVAHGASVLFTAPGIRGRAVVIEARRQWKLGVVVAALSIVTYGSAMLAYRFGATAQLAALRETSVLFGTALAMTFLGEHMTVRRWIAAAVIAGGAVMLQTG